jgi:hypothetical protein
MDSHLYAILPISTLYSMGSINTAKINLTTYERLRRVAVK